MVTRHRVHAICRCLNKPTSLPAKEQDEEELKPRAIHCGDGGDEDALRDAIRRAMCGSADSTRRSPLVVADNFVDGTLVSTCATLCRDSLAPLTASVGQRAVGRDDAIFIFELCDGDSDSDVVVSLAHGRMTASRLVPLVRIARRLMHLSGVLSDELDLPISAPRRLQLARYVQGSIGYARHLDNTVDDADAESRRAAMAGPKGERICDRAVTAIVYLDGHCEGGEFCVYAGADAADAAAEPLERLAPVPGRLVIFPSRSVEHAVLPVSAGERWALSAWFTSCIHDDEDTV